MGQTHNEGIINDIIELAMRTPDYDDANRHEHHSRFRDFLLDVKDLAFAIVDAKAQRVAAFKEGRPCTPATPTESHGAKA